MAYKYKLKEEEGHSKYYPGGKTPGLTTSVMNTILKKIADSGDKDKEVKNGIKEESNPRDIVSVDVPLFIRLLEYAREDAQTDMDLHDVAENIITLSATGKVLTMDDYSHIIGASKEVNESQMHKFSQDEFNILKQAYKENGLGGLKIGLTPNGDIHVYVSSDSVFDKAWEVAKDAGLKAWEISFASKFGGAGLDYVDMAENVNSNLTGLEEDGAGGSMSNAAGGYLGKYAYKLPKKQPKLEEDAAKSANPNAKNPGASLGAGPSAGKSGVTKNAYVKQFKYKVVPQTAEGTYVQKGSGMEVKKLF